MLSGAPPKGVKKYIIRTGGGWTGVFWRVKDESGGFTSKARKPASMNDGLYEEFTRLAETRLAQNT